MKKLICFKSVARYPRKHVTTAIANLVYSLLAFSSSAIVVKVAQTATIDTEAILAHSLKVGEFDVICSRTSLTRVDFENAIAVATAAKIPPPNVQFVAPANYYGGSHTFGGGINGVLAPGAAPMSTSTNTKPRKRLAPDFLGDSDSFRILQERAEKMTNEEMERERASLQLQLAALAQVQKKRKRDWEAVGSESSAVRKSPKIKASTRKASSFSVSSTTTRISETLVSELSPSTVSPTNTASTASTAITPSSLVPPKISPNSKASGSELSPPPQRKRRRLL